MLKLNDGCNDRMAMSVMIGMGEYNEMLIYMSKSKEIHRVGRPL